MESMLRRCHNWDYRQRAIYMVTLTVAERKPLLGQLVGGESDASIELLPLGKLVADCWRELTGRYPDVTLLEHQVMPDHFHGIVFVEEVQPKPLGAIIGSFKSRSTSLFRQAQSARGLAQNQADAMALPSSPSCAQPRSPACAQPHALPRSPSCVQPRAAASCPSLPDLWSRGYQDTILFRKGQLANMRAYILDNPRRLAIKRAHPDLFRIVRNLQHSGITFAAIGNHFLLERPVRLQVQCSRSLSAEALAQKQLQFLSAAKRGAVLVSPCISPGEKQIAKAALNAGLPLIVLLENGFPKYYKPPGTYFEACAAGKLLMLAPWSHHTDKRTITREQCLALNSYAQAIAEGGQ